MTDTKSTTPSSEPSQTLGFETLELAGSVWRQLELELLPGGRGVLKAARPAKKIDGFLGLLAGRTEKTATIEEINEAAEAGWTGKK